MQHRPGARVVATILGLTLSAVALAPAAPARADERGAGGGANVAAQGYMGVQLEPAGQGNLRVVSVPANSPAERAGVQAGDVIVNARGGPPGSVDTFTRSVRTAGAGAPYAIVVQRGRARVPITVQLEASPAAGGSVSLGSPAPPLSAQLVMGSGPADLAQLRGRVVVVDFWASWCGPCRMLMPALNRLHRRFAAQGLTVLGVTDESAAIARSVGAQMSIAYTLASDGQAAVRYGVQGLPTTVVIDRRGNVRRVGVGVDANELRQLDHLVQQLLAEPAP